jgi:hypothetical protein
VRGLDSDMSDVVAPGTGLTFSDWRRHILATVERESKSEAICMRVSRGDQVERSGQHVLSRGCHDNVRLSSIGFLPLQVQDDRFCHTPTALLYSLLKCLFTVFWVPVLDRDAEALLLPEKLADACCSVLLLHHRTQGTQLALAGMEPCCRSAQRAY